MNPYYKVDMTNQWGPGAGVLIDLNCGWHCLDALLKWYCVKRNLATDTYKNNIPCSRWGVAYDVGASPYTLQINIAPGIAYYKEKLEQYGPIIAGGSLGMSLLGRMGLEHYILIVGVDEIKGKIYYYNPLSIKMGNFTKSKHSVDNFSDKVYKINETHVLNKYSCP